MMFICGAKGERGWWKNRMEEELPWLKHRTFICSGYPATCTHSIETALLPCRKPVSSLPSCCWRPLQPLPAAVVAGGSIRREIRKGKDRKGREGKGRGEEGRGGKERGGEGREGEGKKGKDGKGKERKPLSLINEKKRKHFCPYTC